MSIHHRLACSSMAFLLIAGLMAGPSASAGDAGAFIGGAVAGQVVGQTRRNKKAVEAQQRQQAYSGTVAAQPVQQAAPASTEQSVEQRLADLDKLAAGGYITPEEYKAKKQAILDSI